jgi:drug/metabolite transporter (DMT)-like permease
LNKSSAVPKSWKVIAYTSCALLAFAGNSLLCRLALGSDAIDAASFTGLRLGSGALVLALLMACAPRRSGAAARGSWVSAAALFAYAAGFSFAYLTLSIATGALILFGAVQLTMLLAAHLCGEPFRRNELIGAGLAFAGLCYLVTPGVTAPSLTGSLLMAGAGIAWGIYSLRGRRSLDPLSETTRNFALTLPCVALLGLCFFNDSHVSLQGGLLAFLSGGLASGVGYALWYAALPGMTATRASIVQLAVPLLAALAGTIFLAEALSARLVFAAAAILGGIALAVIQRSGA